MAGNTKSGRIAKGKQPEKEPPDSTINVTPPEYLKGESLIYWNKVIKILCDRQSYSDADYEALEMLSVLYGQWRELSEQLAEDGMTYKTTTDRGSYVIREHPSVKTMLSVVKQVETYQRKFGLTPLDRPAIKKTASPRNSVRDKY